MYFIFCCLKHNLLVLLITYIIYKKRTHIYFVCLVVIFLFYYCFIFEFRIEKKYLYQDKEK